MTHRQVWLCQPCRPPSALLEAITCTDPSTNSLTLDEGGSALPRGSAGRPAVSLPSLALLLSSRSQDTSAACALLVAQPTPSYPSVSLLCLPCLADESSVDDDPNPKSKLCPWSGQRSGGASMRSKNLNLHTSTRTGI